jgi:hypothetical protein
VNGVHASEGGQQPSLVHLLRTYSTLLKHQLVTHDYIPGVLCGSNRLGKRLLEPLKLKGSSVASMPKIGPNFASGKAFPCWMARPRYLHFGCSTSCGHQ